MKYKKLNTSELKQRLKSLVPGANEFVVEHSLDGDEPTIVFNEVMHLKKIFELVEKQGFKVNEINGVYSEGSLRECIGITLNNPFIHEKTKECIEGIFIVGNPSENKGTNYLYSFLFRATKPYSETVHFSVDIVAKNKEVAKSIFYKKIDSFKYPSQEEAFTFEPTTHENGDWVEMEPKEHNDETRFLIDQLTLEKINKLF